MSKSAPSASLCIAARLENLAVIRRFVEDATTALGIDPATVASIILAVDEATSNIITHGYQGQPGDIEIDVQIYALSIFSGDFNRSCDHGLHTLPFHLTSSTVKMVAPASVSLLISSWFQIDDHRLCAPGHVWRVDMPYARLACSLW